MRKFALVVGAVLGLCGSASGQDVPRAEVFGGFSYLNFDLAGAKNALGISASTVPNRLSLNGWDAAAAVNFNRWVGIEGDFSGHYKGNCAGESGLTCKNLSFLGGPRFTFRKGKITAFGHGLFGGETIAVSASAATVATLLTGVQVNGPGLSDTSISLSNKSFSLAVGGGLDYAATKRISLRVGQLDYVLSQHYQDLNLPRQNNLRVSAGVVFTLGGTREASSGGRGQTTSAPIQTAPASEAALLGVSGYATDTGFKITSVRAGSPAAQIYLSPGDTIFQIDGRDVQSSHDIEAAIAASASGTVKVTFRNHEALGAKSEREVKVR